MLRHHRSALVPSCALPRGEVAGPAILTLCSCVSSSRTHKSTPLQSCRLAFEQCALTLTVLEVLYTRRRLDSESQGLSPLDLERLIGRAREQLEFTIWYLVQKKYVLRGDSAMLTITVEGAEYLENNYQNSVRQRRLTAARTA